MADVIVNHMSSDSPQFKDFFAQGSASRFDGLFLTREAVFPNGITAAEQAAIYRPRAGSPFTPVVLANGEDPARRGRLRDQAARHELLHAAADV